MSTCNYDHFKKSSYDENHRCKGCNICDGCNSKSGEHGPTCVYSFHETSKEDWFDSIISELSEKDADFLRSQVQIVPRSTSETCMLCNYMFSESCTCKCGWKLANIPQIKAELGRLSTLALQASERDEREPETREYFVREKVTYLVIAQDETHAEKIICNAKNPNDFLHELEDRSIWPKEES